MTLVVPNVGENLMLAHALNKTAPEDLTLKLYKNNVTPGESDTAGTFTEATFTGYASVSLTGSNWTITSGAPTAAVYAQQTFQSSANQTPETVYGYFVIGASSGTLYWAERFDTSQVIQNNNDTIRVTPRLTGE